MPSGLRFSFYFTGFCWLLVFIGVFAMCWGGEPEAVHMVVGVGPVATVASVAAFIEWRVWKKDV